MSIQVGNLVKFKYNDMIIEKRLAEDSWNDITPLSSVGQAMLGKKVGDKFNVRVHKGTVEIEILGVSK